MPQHGALPSLPGLKLHSLEDPLLSGQGCSLVNGALIASGVRSRRQLLGHLRRVRLLAERFRQEVPVAPDDAKAHMERLFDWLWKRHPARFRPGASFRLTQVLDAEAILGPGPVGNCLGLTLLYNVLAEELGTQAQALHLPDAFSRGPHVLSLLRLGGETVEVEHMFPWGFDYSGHRGDPSRLLWGAKDLVADVYTSVGNQLMEEGELDEAVAAYRRALMLNPGYQTPRLNLGMALAQMGRDREAEATLA